MPLKLIKENIAKPPFGEVSSAVVSKCALIHAVVFRPTLDGGDDEAGAMRLR
jgi:hypothetical protein